jgi:hypothetical protein
MTGGKSFRQKKHHSVHSRIRQRPQRTSNAADVNVSRAKYFVDQQRDLYTATAVQSRSLRKRLPIENVENCAYAYCTVYLTTVVLTAAQANNQAAVQPAVPPAAWLYSYQYTADVNCTACNSVKGSGIKLSFQNISFGREN